MRRNIPLLLLSATSIKFIAAFMVPRSIHHTRVSTQTDCRRGLNNPSFSRLFALPEIAEMKLSQIREELESYGISTKSFLEKTELVGALEKARSEGKKPINKNKKNVKKEAKSEDNGVNGAGAPNGEASSNSGVPREVRLKEEMKKAKGMKVGDLKKKLQEFGVSTKSFFEKSEFVKAYAEAIVDGVQKKKGSARATQQEDFDPSYRDVVVQKFDRMSQQRLLSGTLIDIKLA
jgi:hypothetical protein